MVRNEIISLFHQVGRILHVVANDLAYTNQSLAITKDELERFRLAVRTMERQNPWFTEIHVKQALAGVAIWLNEEKLKEWLADYPVSKSPKNVGIIMAGNIPMVGFHDFLCVILSGHKAHCKLSSQDALLWQAFFQMCEVIDSRISEHYIFSSGLMKDFDAVIATGSNNSAITFKNYFDKYPHIIRQNRTSIAVLSGRETDQDLEALSDDIFSYYGFGCRNVSQIFVPEDFDIQRLFGAFVKYGDYINHNKYMNNYDYYRSLYMLNGENVLENGFILLRIAQDLHAPPAVLNCHRYSAYEKVETFISEKSEQIQVVIGFNGTPFGQAQCPSLTDYADGVDVMSFLDEL